MDDLFDFPDPVNEVSARLVAAGVVVLTLVILLGGQTWAIGLLAYGFLARVLTGPTLSPLGQLVTRVITPSLKRPAKLVPGPPKRFAQGIGAVLSITTVYWSVRRVPELPLSEAELRAMRAKPRGAMATLREIVDALRAMPPTMRRLWWMKLFQWCTNIHSLKHPAGGCGVGGAVDGSPGPASMVGASSVSCVSYGRPGGSMVSERNP